jgi:hypothetical protein
MKWGVRSGESAAPVAVTITGKRPISKKLTTTGGSNQPASADAKDAAVYKRTAKKSSTDALSTKELTALVSRMNMEQQYDRLVKGTRDEAGTKFAGRIVKDHGAKSVAVVGGIALSKHPAMVGAKGVRLAVKVATVLAKSKDGNGNQKKKKK